MTTTPTHAAGTEPAGTARAITLPDRGRRGVSTAVVIGWIIAALGVGFALGRLLPASLFG
jgi:hypothetical protein